MRHLLAALTSSLAVALVGHAQAPQFSTGVRTMVGGRIYISGGLASTSQCLAVDRGELTVSARVAAGGGNPLQLVVDGLPGTTTWLPLVMLPLTAELQQRTVSLPNNSMYCYQLAPQIGLYGPPMDENAPGQIVALRIDWTPAR